MAGRLDGKRCLIVGGTSGIGRAAASRFAEEGAHLVVAGLEQSESQWYSVQTDVRDPKQAADLFRETLTILGGLDVLFHVAGGSGRRAGDGPLHDCSDDGWRFTLDLNLTTTFLTNRAAVRQFLTQKSGGVILNVSTKLVDSPSPCHFDTVAYAAAKGGVNALSRLAAARYASDGIRVNVLAPGLVDTPMATRAVSDPAIQAFLATKQPLAQGPLRAMDCADAVVFLCSDEARMITGAVLPVDGGWDVSER